MIIPNCRKIVGGAGEGRVLVTRQPINFLSTIDVKTGRLTGVGHELDGESIKDTVFVYPYAIGSSVGAYTIHALRVYGTAPSAIVCSKADITTASGCAIANIPAVTLPKNASLALIAQGIPARVEADSCRIVLKD